MCFPTSSDRNSLRVFPDGEEETITPEDVSSKRRTEPGELRRSLQGDLDNIAVEALRFDPNGRYTSAAALADDLERYLTGRPVRARADSVWYRTSKFVRRNRAASLIGAALVLTLIAGTAVTYRRNGRIQAQATRLSDERTHPVHRPGARSRRSRRSGTRPRPARPGWAPRPRSRPVSYARGCSCLPSSGPCLPPLARRPTERPPPRRSASISPGPLPDPRHAGTRPLRRRRSR